MIPYAAGTLSFKITLKFYTNGQVLSEKTLYYFTSHSPLPPTLMLHTFLPQRFSYKTTSFLLPVHTSDRYCIPVRPITNLMCLSWVTLPEY